VLEIFKSIEKYQIFYEILILLKYLENSNLIQGAGQVGQNDNWWPAKSIGRPPIKKVNRAE
jgi:hypothetical protein